MASDNCATKWPPAYPEWCGQAEAVAIRTQKAPLPLEWRFAVLRWSLASQVQIARWFVHRRNSRLSRPVVPIFRVARLASALAGCLLDWAGRIFSQQPVHHW